MIARDEADADRTSKYRIVGVSRSSRRWAFAPVVFAEDVGSGGRPNILYVQNADRSGRIRSFVEFDDEGGIDFFDELHVENLATKDNFQVGDQIVFGFLDGEQVLVGSRIDLKNRLSSILAQLRESKRPFLYLDLARFIQSDADIAAAIAETRSELSKYSPEVDSLWQTTLISDLVRDSISETFIESGISESLIERLTELRIEKKAGSATVSLPAEFRDRKILNLVKRGIVNTNNSVLSKALGVTTLSLATGVGVVGQSDLSDPVIWLFSHNKLHLEATRQISAHGWRAQGVGISRGAVDWATIFKRVDFSEDRVHFVCSSCDEFEALLEMLEAPLKESLHRDNRAQVSLLLLQDRNENALASKLEMLLRRYRLDRIGARLILLTGHNLSDASATRLSRASKEARHIRRAIEALLILDRGQDSASRVSRGIREKYHARIGEVMILGWRLLPKNFAPSEVSRALYFSTLNTVMQLSECRAASLLSLSDRGSLGWLYEELSRLRGALGEYSAAFTIPKAPLMISSGAMPAAKTRNCVYLVGVGRVQSESSKRETGFRNLVLGQLFSNGWSIGHITNLPISLSLEADLGASVKHGSELRMITARSRSEVTGPVEAQFIPLHLERFHFPQGEFLKRLEGGVRRISQKLPLNLHALTFFVVNGTHMGKASIYHRFQFKRKNPTFLIHFSQIEVVNEIVLERTSQQALKVRERQELF